jgi:predicted amidophosphoribosyltransferase
MLQRFRAHLRYNPIGYDAHGNPQFETTRSPLGELLFQLKYRGQQTAPQVAEVVAHFFADKPHLIQRVNLILPMPPSTVRSTQPVWLITQELGRRLNKAASADVVKKIRETPELKNIQDKEERQELLDGAFDVNQTLVNRKTILLLDDLYRSGATANAVTIALLKAGAARVYFLAVTRTRRKL